jgi:hypothetical protein
MTDSRDCVVLGDSLAGLTAAGCCSLAGRTTSLVSTINDPPKLPDLAALTIGDAAWLDRCGAILDPPLATVVGLQLYDECGRRLQAPVSPFPVYSVASLQQALLAALVRHDVRVEEGHSFDQAKTAAIKRIDARGSECPTAQGVIWGTYRGVSEFAAGDGQQAIAFRSADRSGWCWLVPQCSERTLVGVTVDEQARADDPYTRAAQFEDALVACPLLLSRLHSAELVGELNGAERAVIDPWGLLTAAQQMEVGRRFAGEEGGQPMKELAERLRCFWDRSLEPSRLESLWPTVVQTFSEWVFRGEARKPAFPPSDERGILTRV